MSMAAQRRMKRLLISSDLIFHPRRHFTATTSLCFQGGGDRPLRGSGSDRKDHRYSSTERTDTHRIPSRGSDNNGGGRPDNRRSANPPRSNDRMKPPFSTQSPYIHDNLSDCPSTIAKQGQSFLNKFKLAGGLDTTTHKQQQQQQQQTQNQTQPPPQDADEIFKSMKEKGLIPNAVAMLDGLCKDGLVQDAMKLFGLMREKGTIPQVVIYTAVVQGFCKGHKFDDAKRIFRKMQNNAITPNAFSYTVLIQGLCNGRCFQDALDFSLEMLEAGHSPNVATFTALIDGFCNDKGGVEEAEKIIKRLRENGFFVNDKAVKEHLDKKGPFSPLVWEAIFGKKESQRLF